jgi:hypothetical protein
MLILSVGRKERRKGPLTRAMPVGNVRLQDLLIRDILVTDLPSMLNIIRCSLLRGLLTGELWKLKQMPPEQHAAFEATYEEFGEAEPWLFWKKQFTIVVACDHAPQVIHAALTCDNVGMVSNVVTSCCGSAEGVC